MKPEEQDLIFAINVSENYRLNVYVIGPPEDYRVYFCDPQHQATIGIAKCDWQRIVERVAAQF